MYTKVFSCKSGVMTLFELWRIKGLYDAGHCLSTVVGSGFTRRKEGLLNIFLNDA